ncbi:unnamed protein product [Danaus chrysippus]|uniref:(African queen) hypothetical protein n=1 Tax=Danaus chrysippus TaxID=151541 RepID=A0A8J2Q7K5_9NEOP|nr:unnamed protein product [Danaus chrysippus]
MGRFATGAAGEGGFCVPEGDEGRELAAAAAGAFAAFEGDWGAEVDGVLEERFLFFLETTVVNPSSASLSELGREPDSEAEAEEHSMWELGVGTRDSDMNLRTNSGAIFRAKAVKVCGSRLGMVTYFKWEFYQSSLPGGREMST